MKRMLTWIMLVVIVSAGLGAARPATAQDGGEKSCPALVEAAYATTAEVCAGAGRDEACYGSASVAAAPDTLAFAAPGDLAALAEIESLRLSAMDVDAGVWGVSLLRVQAGDTLENIEIVLFGDVEIQNAGVEIAALNVSPAGTDNLNVRGGPSTTDAIVGTLAPGDSVPASGRNAAGDWLRVTLADGVGGWVYAPLLTIDGDPASLPVLEASEAPPTYGPMQAFTFRSGVDDAPCAEAPQSGLLIQTPQGVGEITLLINEVTVELGSTAFLQAVPGVEMRFSVVEGTGRMTAFDVTSIIPAGSWATVPLDAAGVASGPPTDPQPYDQGIIGALPVNLLAAPVTVPPPLTQAELDALLNPPLAGDWAVSWGREAVPATCNDGRATTYRFDAGLVFTFKEEDGGLVADMKLLTAAISQTSPGNYTISWSVPENQFSAEINLTMISPDVLEGAWSSLTPCSATNTLRLERVK